MPTFDVLLADNDSDADGAFDRDEVPDDLYVFHRPEIGGIDNTELKFGMIFGGFDQNQDGVLNRDEWDAFRKMLDDWDSHGMVKLKRGGRGDVSLTHVAWKEDRAVPEVPSPLVVGPNVYMVKNGGILTCMDKQTGRVLFRSRLGPVGAYFASLVEAGDKIYASSLEGVVVVFAAGDRLQVLARNDLQEPIAATPAIVDDTLYV